MSDNDSLELSRQDTLHRRPRVLFVGAFPPPGTTIFGGMVSDCRALLQSSLPRRVTLDLFDTTQISNPPPGLAMRALLAVRRMFHYFSRFERTRPDAVLLFAAVGGSLIEKGAMGWYARLRGVPALLCPRSGGIIDDSRKSRLTRLWARWSFAGARMVLCQGAASRDFLANDLGLGAGRARVVSSWTAVPELLAVGGARVVSDAAPRLFFMGWLDRAKGVMELLEACRILAVQRHFTVELAGEGDVSEEARQFVLDHGLAERVQLLGWLRGEQVRGALTRADVFVLPSWSEGLPNAMIEAMAAGLAIVVSAVGSIPDVLVDGHDGLLVPPRDVGALVAALIRVIDNRALRESLGRAAFVVAEEKFGVEPAAVALELAIREAIDAAKDR